MESEFLKSAHREIERTLQRCVSCEEGAPHEALFQAATYALFPGGKRIRPLFVIAAALDLGAPLEAALIPACALELIHTYSLIHDDLPCMDDDALRRGKASLHIAFDEGLAVLTGDFLQAKAFELVATAPTLSDKQRLNLVTTLAKRSGSEGMIGGQVVDIAPNEKADGTWIDAKKTGALFACALEFGGIVAGTDLEFLGKLGEEFGIAFQQHDDFIDGERITPRATLEHIRERSTKMPLVRSLIDQFAGNYA